MKLRTLLYGLVAGLLLSALRAPQGLDWTQLGAVQASTAAFFRAGALIALALFLDGGRPAFKQLQVWSFLLAVTAGYAAHGLWIAPAWQPTGRLGFALLLVLGTLVLWRLAGPMAAEEEPDEDAADPPSLWERLGIVIAASGAAIGFENLAHHVRLLGLGLPEDDTVMGTVFLLTLAVGALAFGGLVARSGWQRFVVASGLALAGAATLFGLGFVARLGPAPLFQFLGRIDLDFSRIGTWKASAFLSGAAFVVPCFVAGTALSAARNPARLKSVALGVAVGILLAPHVIESVARPLDDPDYRVDTYAFRVLATGCAIAFAGAVLVCAGDRGSRRVVGLALAVVALLVPWTRSDLAILSFSPWATATIQPEFVLPTPQGIVTVERTPRGAQIVTLDRKRLSPTGQERLVDQHRIRSAFALLDDAKREAPGPNVLFIGQMTMPRALVLESLAPLRLDRTAPWYDALEEVEARLFPVGLAPPGDLVSPAEARSRIRDGDYDLVLAMPTHGPVVALKSHARLPWGVPEEPVLAGLSVPEGTVGVAWFDAGSGITRRHLGEYALIAMDRFQYLSVAAVWNAEPTEADPERPLLFPTGAPQSRIGALELLSIPPRERYFPLRSSLCDRLAEAAIGTPAEHVARGLALHYGAQKQSSPYESVAQRIEVDEDALRAFYDAAASIDFFTRTVWEGLAWLLAEKRMPDMVLAYVEGVAELHAPWPLLDLAVAEAYREFLEPEEAQRFAERGLAAAPRDPALLVLNAELAQERGEHADAVQFLRRALDERPGDYELLRTLGLALQLADDPEGTEILERLLQQEPDDPILRDALRIGPLPTENG